MMKRSLFVLSVFWMMLISSGCGDPGDQATDVGRDVLSETNITDSPLFEDVLDDLSVGDVLSSDAALMDVRSSIRISNDYELSHPVLLKKPLDGKSPLTRDMLVFNPTPEQERQLAIEIARFKNQNRVERRLITLSDGRQIEQVVVIGRPPEGFRMSPSTIAVEERSELLTVPAYDWCYGCSATSAAMMAAYYDNIGYSNMYAGPTNGGVAPMDNSAWGYGECPLSATHMGYDGLTSRGHVDDFWISSNSNDPDPYITGGWTPHNYADCTADFMKTSQSAYGNSDGATMWYYWPDNSPYDGLGDNNDDGGYGLRNFFESRGYSVQSQFNQHIEGYDGESAGFTYEQYAMEIDAGRPVLIHVTNHTMLGVGYVDGSETIVIHDTWDNSSHDMQWGGLYNGLQHHAVTVIRLERICQCSSGECCDGCYFESSSTVCRASDGVCNPAEYCTGSSAFCPADVVNEGAVCRSSKGDCDPAEYCDAAGSCPPDRLHPLSEECRPVDGSCDMAEYCTGISPTCPPDKFISGNVICRVSAGDCDLTEYCTGNDPDCPSNSFVSSTTECRPVDGVCDEAEFCTGHSPECPSNQFSSDDKMCRDSAGICDVAEFCTGQGPDCPQDWLVGSNEVCRESVGVCDVEEFCSGDSPLCPSDRYLPMNTICRAINGLCDTPEVCSGTDPLCPENRFLPADHMCRNSGGVCDLAEFCSGYEAQCPPDHFVSTNHVCRPASGICDKDENCTGDSALCPFDEVMPSDYLCRESNGICDVEEYCDGYSGECPDDRFADGRKVCRPAEGDCDIKENCNGIDTDCPPNQFKKVGQECRPVAGVCDRREVCTGDSAFCPEDGFAPQGIECRPVAGACDVPESCTGDAATCPLDQLQDVTYECRPSKGDCDTSEFCSGFSASCPQDLIVPKGSLCDDGLSDTKDDVCNESGQCAGTKESSWGCQATSGSGSTGIEVLMLLALCGLSGLRWIMRISASKG